MLPGVEDHIGAVINGRVKHVEFPHLGSGYQTGGGNTEEGHLWGET
jgi:hypothetical protein